MLNFKRPHQIHGSERGQTVALQDGQLYTMNGRRIPQDIHPDRLGDFAVPPHLQFLLTGPVQRPVHVQVNPFSAGLVPQAYAAPPPPRHLQPAFNYGLPTEQPPAPAIPFTVAGIPGLEGVQVDELAEAIQVLRQLKAQAQIQQQQQQAQTINPMGAQMPWSIGGPFDQPVMPIDLAGQQLPITSPLGMDILSNIPMQSDLPTQPVLDYETRGEGGIRERRPAGQEKVQVRVGRG